jgi:predicted RNA-binding protein Jag
MDPEALSAVESAIEKLERDPSTRFVDLPPTNSFQRRKQHHTISERGFQSQSVGEGENRAVRVLRGQQA